MSRDLYNDKVEIPAWVLIEVKRMIRALSEDKESYLHKVFSDDHCYQAIHEIEKAYDNYFD